MLFRSLIDAPAPCFKEPLEADILLMDNQSNIYLFIQEMIQRGKTNIGFIGKHLHCHSFFERYTAYRQALYLSGLPCPDAYCITGNPPEGRDLDPAAYQDYLTECLQKLKHMPDVFLCANDFVAIDAMQVLKKLGYSVPQDVYLCGFDDSPDAKIVTDRKSVV